MDVNPVLLMSLVYFPAGVIMHVSADPVCEWIPQVCSYSYSGQVPANPNFDTSLEFCKKACGAGCVAIQHDPVNQLWPCFIFTAVPTDIVTDAAVYPTSTIYRKHCVRDDAYWSQLFHAMCRDRPRGYNYSTPWNVAHPNYCNGFIRCYHDSAQLPCEICATGTYFRSGTFETCELATPAAIQQHCGQRRVVRPHQVRPIRRSAVDCNPFPYK
ncbi:uncharacterized protein LOC143276003 [Babylonia areolata]|uniref:uncharacterized protein LOC143276003 n=1 Tax=Babylonia areolata TaxID=304850 RepID=UPI003FD2DB13